MKKIPLCLLCPMFALAQNVLSDYEGGVPSRDVKPLELYTADDVVEMNKKANDAELQQLLDELPDGQSDKHKAYIDLSKDYQAAIKTLERNRRAIAFNEFGQWPVWHFFYERGNQLTCGNVTIVDAAQKHDSGTTLTLKFKHSNSFAELPRNFTNTNLRRLFSVYTKGGNEIAYYNPRQYQKVQRLERDQVYRVSYRTKFTGSDILNDIRCSDNHQTLLKPDGKYSGFP